MAKFLKIVFGGIFGDRKIAVAEADVKMLLFSSNNFLKLLRNLDCFLTPDYFYWICDAILAKNFSFWLDLTKIRRWRNIFRQNGRKAKFDDNFSSQLGGFFIRVGRHVWKSLPSNSTCSVLVRISMDKSELWPINNKFLSGYCYWLQSSFWHQRNSYSLRNLTGLFMESADPPK